MGLAGMSAMSGGVFLAMQALSNKMLNPGPDAELVKANQQLSTNLGEITNRLHQEVGKSALAMDVLVNAVHTGDVPAAIVEEAKAMKESRNIEKKDHEIDNGIYEDVAGHHHSGHEKDYSDHSYSAAGLSKFKGNWI